MPLAGSSLEFGSCLSSGTTGELQMMAGDGREGGGRERRGGGEEGEKGNGGHR